MSKKLFSKVFILLLVVGLLFAASYTVQAQEPAPTTLNVAEWTDPVTLAVSGRPTVLKDGDTYRMWYGASDTALYHTTSTDPSSFATGDLVEFNVTPYEVASPAIIKEGDTFYMIAYETATDKAFALYTSENGKAWTKGDTVFDATGMDDLGKIDAPFLFKDGDTYRLYFQKKNAAGTSYHIYTAEASSLDGTDFALVAGVNPVLSPGSTGTWDSNFVMHPWVIKDNGVYYMYYSAYGTTQIIGMAKSADGYSWVKSPANPILGPVGEPSVINDGGTWRMWYLGSDGLVNYFTSNGPIEYTSIQTAIDAAASGDTINVAAGTYNENITINKANITLQSTGTAEETIINANEGFGVNILKDLGTVTIDGFTVKGWLELGIVQSTANRPGTTSRILNNIVIGESGGVNHGNGIQVTGDNSLVKGNTVTGAYYIGSGPYGASGILVYAANYAVVRENTVSGADNGIAVYAGGYHGLGSITGVLVTENEVSGCDTGISVAFDANNTTITKNYVHDNLTGLHEGFMSGLGPTDTQATYNKIVDNPEQAAVGSFDETNIPEDHIFFASPNWWGSIAGPAEGQIVGDVDFVPWCANEDCTTLVEDSADDTLDDENSTLTLGEGEDVEISVSYTGTGSVEVFLGSYDSNPAEDIGGFIGDDNTFYDIFVANSTDKAATLQVEFSLASAGQVLRWWEYSTWKVVISNDGSIPVAGADGKLSVVFGPNSYPSLADLSGTPFTASTPDSFQVLFDSDQAMVGGLVTARLFGSSTSFEQVEIHLVYDPSRLRLQNVSISDQPTGGPAITGQTGVDGTIDLVFRLPQGQAPGSDILLTTLVFVAGDQTGPTGLQLSGVSDTLFRDQAEAPTGFTANDSLLVTLDSVEIAFAHQYYLPLVIK